MHLQICYTAFHYKKYCNDGFDTIKSNVFPKGVNQIELRLDKSILSQVEVVLFALTIRMRIVSHPQMECNLSDSQK